MLKDSLEELPCIICLGSEWGRGEEFRKKKKTCEYKMMIGNWGVV